MGCNFGCGNNGCLWIIIILIILFCCCGNNGIAANDCGCNGCNNCNNGCC